MSKYGESGDVTPKRVPPHKKVVEGDMEMLEEAFEVSSNYLYKILSYADKEEIIPDEVLERERAIFSFCMQGPRAGNFRLNKKGKLCSADVLYIMCNTQSAPALAEKFGVNELTIKSIRKGMVPGWNWEWQFVNRMKTIIKHTISQSTYRRHEILYSISKVTEYGTKEILMYTTSKVKARALRESLIHKATFKALMKREELDILYPIERIEVVK